MILDSVEYHEPDDGQLSWRNVAPLLAALCLWARQADLLSEDPAAGLSVTAVKQLGAADILPSEWVMKHLDCVLLDTLFDRNARPFLKKLISSGKYYELVKASDSAGSLYGLADDWNGLATVVACVQREWDRSK